MMMSGRSILISDNGIQEGSDVVKLDSTRDNWIRCL
jgi:hypothetical protein